LPEVESTCDRAVVINRGKLVAEGTIESLRARRATKGASLVVSDTKGEAKGIAAAVPGVASVVAESVPDGLTRLDVGFAESEGDGGPRLEEIVARLVSAGVGVREATRVRASLEDIFRDLTVSDVAEGETAKAEAKGEAT
jgi:ABC-2 type transport system ATP-binding protein